MFELTTRFHGDAKATKVIGFTERSMREQLSDAIRTGYCEFAQLVAYEKLGEPVREGRVLHTYGAQ
jgi:hypothetical protein